MAVKALEEISRALFDQKPDQEVQPLIDELFVAGVTDPTDLLALYKHLPRRLTTKHIDAVLQAETTLQNTEVSQLLLASEFDGLEALRAKDEAKFQRVVDHAVRKVGALEASAAAGLEEWRLYLIRSKNAKLDLEQHCIDAIVAALLSPSQLILEPIVDAVSGVALKNPKAKSLLTLAKDVMVDATGLPGLANFEKAGGAQLLADLQLADIVRRKALIVSLSRLVAGKDSVGFDELKKGLSVATDDEVEKTVIDAALAGIIHAAVSKEERIATIHSVEPLKFDKEAWKTLSAQLERWIQLTERASSTSN